MLPGFNGWWYLFLCALRHLKLKYGSVYGVFQNMDLSTEVSCSVRPNDLWGETP